MTPSPLSNNMPRRFEGLRYFPRERRFARSGLSVRIKRPMLLQFMLPLVYGAVMANEEMIDHMWGHRLDGGPDDAQKALDVYCHMARLALAPLEIAFGTKPQRVYRAFDLRLEEYFKPNDGRRRNPMSRNRQTRFLNSWEVAHAAA